MSTPSSRGGGPARETPTYSVPASLFPDFPGRPVILRTADPAEPPVILGAVVPEGVAFVQLSDLTTSMTPLEDWGEGVPLDLLMADPGVELPLLYRCTGLLTRHPVRVTIPLIPGLARAVKLALSLGFAVRLSGHQPTPEVIAEARQALQAYLHNPTVSQPVEPWHSLLLAFLHDAPVSLWSLLERDPEQVRALDDKGEALADQGPASVAAFRDRLVADGAECRGCTWLPVCDGYFKWPRADYGCMAVKQLFADLQEAAAELRQGLATYEASRGGTSHGV